MASCAFAAMNATFDLSPLHKAGGAYHVEDKFDATRNYTYSVNVCGSVDPRELAAACDGAFSTESSLPTLRVPSTEVLFGTPYRLRSSSASLGLSPPE